MRRKERQISEFNDIVDVLSRCDTVRIGINDERPYILPVSFGYEVVDHSVVIYFHGAKEGRKIDLLNNDPVVFVEADICHGFKDTGHSVTCEYESVMARGRVTLAKDPKKGMDLLLEHCGFKGYPYDDKVFEVMSVYEIELKDITGKRNV